MLSLPAGRLEPKACPREGGDEVLRHRESRKEKIKNVFVSVWIPAFLPESLRPPEMLYLLRAGESLRAGAGMTDEEFSETRPLA
ncbi:hypothetical protein A3K24_00515 [candidate division Kazan bacterium RIFCSPHIGHO2_01_FULL_44_14]|uniref:Uncharacterized protein n=1 Tax=candidate division Kazan bacterium RIFCSPLOWO2_01_FULL_45_19 TaxID=1798538 RepID=A0A1F4NPH2_UNCK3|nr:MAG: hypothetical protein A3K51_00515 [candidate division Kazan bacterium RIFCSPLOWO2_01_FULL_45_19]OGB77594.1 MAG: hypothetical protein A3K24_00515 [candidate division Kazan bacterium RIFCSPHIGHO2_01_FULL_44_14]